MAGDDGILVGVHFHRHFGGPGRLQIAPGSLVLTTRRGNRSVTHGSSEVSIVRKRWEPPTGNYWIEISDGTLTGWATVPRRRAERIAAELETAGFSVTRSG